MGKRPAGSWEKRPEWVIEVMTTNPTPREKARWSMLKFTLKDDKLLSTRANGTDATRLLLEDAVVTMGIHFEKNIKPFRRYRSDLNNATYRFRNLVSNEVIPWELLADE